ncbi:MAG: hypothetical protein MZV64_30490 [Ignavibacteriales bacterium]|nr:hypothetical protein [Ignavibacteriales bacterium]
MTLAINKSLALEVSYQHDYRNLPLTEEEDRLHHLGESDPEFLIGGVPFVAVRPGLPPAESFLHWIYPIPNHLKSAIGLRY